jgi:hypothetical protein
MGAEFTSSGQTNPVPAHAAISTSLKWGSNGELSPVDLQRVLERLTDPSLTQCTLNPESQGD